MGRSGHHHTEQGILSENPGAKVIGDVKCSRVMFDAIGKCGGVPIMWKTGHSLIKEKMRQEGALMAGEFSGHIFIGHNYFGYDDALYTTFRLIEIMKKTGKDIKDLLCDVPRMSYTPEIRRDCPEDRKKKSCRQRGIASCCIQKKRRCSIQDHRYQYARWHQGIIRKRMGTDTHQQHAACNSHESRVGR